MITEQSTPKTRARAFSFLAFTGNLGILIGPLIGKRRKKHGPPQSRKLGALSKNAHKKKQVERWQTPRSSTEAYLLGLISSKTIRIHFLRS